MPQLNHSKVYRGGVTARSYSRENSQCSASVDARDGTLQIQFYLASKGGGTTQVLLQIGKEDFQAIIMEFASSQPESAGILLDCAAIAYKKNLELLESARKLNADQKVRAKSLIDDLAAVEEFLYESHDAVPISEDKKQERVRNQLQKVISCLKELR